MGDRAADSESDAVARLRQLIIRLRGKDGCPWDREQTPEDAAGYLLEEAHEVAGAIAERDHLEATAELGDLLFQLTFLARLLEEKGFSTHPNDLATRAHDKMVERHPHVFGNVNLEKSEEVERAWQRRKLEEQSGRPGSILDGTPRSLPALLQAQRIGQKAAGLGFDWLEPTAVISKIEEELSELESELESPSQAALEEELGDLLFATVSLARHLQVNPELALQRACAKFRQRFSAIENQLAELDPSLAPEDRLEAMEALWQGVKRDEKRAIEE